MTGLTATLAAGNFASGADSLTYTVTGTPDTAGTASFALEIGGQSCTLALTAEAGGTSCAPVITDCWAKVSATDTLYFMCHNLASFNTSADPFTPSWEIIGGYWQWGRKGPDSTQWLNTNTANFAFGPTGSGSTEANSDAISGWSTTNAPNGSWLDTIKTVNDPCPPCFRVPTLEQWDGVRTNNTTSTVGSWTAGTTNYSSGFFLGPKLMLPLSGIRSNSNGALSKRGSDGYYWCSRESTGSSTDASDLHIYSGIAPMNSHSRTYGFSVRCAAQ